MSAAYAEGSSWKEMGADMPVMPKAAPQEELGLLERLLSHKTVGAAPRKELEWLAEHGHFEHYEPGHVISDPSRPVPGMFVLLTGRAAIHLIRNGTRHKMAEWHAGEVTGVLPYSRLGAPPGETIIDEPTDVFVLPRDQVPAMTRECHELTSILVHVMLDRARFFNSTMLHDEKLKSLGKLAAGLAHELNNPAAAIRRFAKTLPDCLEVVESAAQTLGTAGLSPDERAFVSRISAECFAAPLTSVRSPLEDAERENAISEWLQARGIDDTATEAIAQSPVTIEALNRFAGQVRTEILEAALRWVAADCAVRRLATDIEHAATRISDLVTAVRGFTQVDSTAAPQAVDIAEGLGHTLAVLAGKARSKSISITVNVEQHLPRVRGVAAELNQIWANLIDNALDAAPARGSVEIAAARERDRVVVCVTDNGAGIPPEIKDRIFDPFFSTKDVGKGTGLGLDITRRLVARHSGDIEVESRPGRTQFIVSLPVAESL